MKHPSRSRRLRRGALAGTLCVLGATALAACGSSNGGGSSSSSSSASTGKACKKLNLLTWEGYADPAVVKPFEQKYGVTVKATYVGSDAELVSKASVQKGQFQVVNVGSATRARSSASGAIVPLDTSRLTNYADVFDFLKPAYELNGKVWGVAQDWSVNPFVYDTSVLKTVPKTLEEALWDPRLKGHLALWNEVSMVYLGASVLGYAKQGNAEQEGGLFNLTDEQLDKVKEKMLSLKGQVRALWSTGGDVIQLFSNKEVGAAPAWAYVYQQLKSKNFPVGEQFYPESGGSAWIDGLGIGANNSKECVDMAYNWINWATSPEMQAVLAKNSGYGASNQTAVKHMDAALIEATNMKNAEALMKDQIVRVDPARPDAYQRVTEEIAAGLK